ncbi:hypothetical protein ABBQ38_011019 [Trebouxia sp. C0009 RCD-2024]
MGAYLSQPVTEKESDEQENTDFKYGVCAMQGWRTEMEDAHLAALAVDSKCSLFGVFDGHGGREVARYVSKYLAQELLTTEAYQRGDTKQALVDAFLKMDQLLSQESVVPELQSLAGPRNPDDEDELALLNDENLPELLRRALEAKREEEERDGMRSGEDSESEMLPSDGPASGTEVSSSADTGAHKSTNAVEWKSTADSAPNPMSAALSKESIVPQRSQAVQDQPTSAEDPHSKGSGLLTKRPRSPASNTPTPPESDPPLPISRRSKAKALAQVKRKRLEAVSEPDEAESDSSPSDSIEKAEPAVQPSRSYRGPSAGCTAVVALVQGDTLLVANAGDSRCVVSEAGKAVPMSFDHKPTDEKEHSRIINAGGYVVEGRVNGSLNLSRAIGDMEYKQSGHLSAAEQAVTANPDVRELQLGPSCEFMILACDGIWDVLSNQQAVDFVRDRLLEGQSVKYISESVCDHCLAKDTAGIGIGCDNMSMMIVVFKRFTSFHKAQAARLDAMTSDLQS